MRALQEARAAENKIRQLLRTNNRQAIDDRASNASEDLWISVYR